MANQVSLDKQKCDEFLVKYLEAGYKLSKSFTIRDGEQIARFCRLISGDEKDEEVKPKVLYSTVFQILESMNKEGCFTLGDATVLGKIMTHVNDDFKKAEETAAENEPKIKEV